MVLLAGGVFQMGCVPGDMSCYPSEKPQHSVKLSPFMLDRFEVTAKKYQDCFGAGACGPADNTYAPCNFGVAGRQDHPINCVSWQNADDYCHWVGGRLPTEAEWEYAARGGKADMLYVWGNAWPPPNFAANLHDLSAEAGSGLPVIPGYNDGYPKTSPVGKFTPNAFGLYDMAGNVWELLADYLDFDYYGVSPLMDPLGPTTAQMHVMRGGSIYTYSTETARISIRGNGIGGTGAYNVGLRCARTPKP